VRYVLINLHHGTFQDGEFVLTSLFFVVAFFKPSSNEEMEIY